MIERCGLVFRVPPAEEQVVAREVMAVELADGDLFVIHAMVLWKKYRPQYEETKRWRL